MQFHDLYTVKTGNTLTRIARARGYTNPGPIVAYPPNQSFFKHRSPNLIRPRDKFFVPWCPELMRKFIKTQEYLIGDVKKTAEELMEGEKKNKEELEDFLFKLDAVNFILQIQVAIGSLALNAEEAAPKASENISKELVEWLVDSRVHMLAGDMAPMVIPAPSEPKQDYRYYFRHAFGFWTPSYINSIIMAVKQGDPEIWMYGSEATSYRNRKQIADQAKLEIIKLQAPLNHARWQLTMPFYSFRI